MSDKYDFAMCDPPWKITMAGRRTRKGTHTLVSDLSYTVTEPIKAFEIYAENVMPRMAENHILWLWCTEQTLNLAEDLAAEAGYRQHIRVIWNKNNGIPYAFTLRFCHEYLLWLWKGKMPPMDKAMRGKMPSVLTESSRQHSRKPDIAYQWAEKLWPDARRIDVFSRENRPGWDAWGHECGKFS